LGFDVTTLTPTLPICLLTFSALFQTTKHCPRAKSLTFKV
jgi:hypothetical protein